MATFTTYPSVHLAIGATLAVFLGLGCAQRGNDVAPSPALPVIQRLDPASGPAGTAYPIRITIHGTGFADSGNVVTFFSIPVPALGEEGATRIVFLAPKQRPSTGEVPPFVLPPGEYDVTVTTPAGTSEPATFTLTRGAE